MKIRRRGVYAPLSARYYEDPAIGAAGHEAELLFVRGLAYCAGEPTDGFISDAALRFVCAGLRNVERRLRALCSAGLWVRDPERGGYQIRAWLKWNPSQEDISAARDRDAARKRPAPARRNPPPIRPESARKQAGIPPTDTDTDTDTGSPPPRRDGGGLPGWRELPPGVPPPAGWRAARAQLGRPS